MKNVQASTTKTYQSVIDETISKVKPEFVQEGVDESVLDELRSLWEATLVKTGVLADDNEEDEEESEDYEEPVGGYTRPQPTRPVPAQVLHSILPGGGLAQPPMSAPPSMGMGMRPLGMMMPPHYAMMQQFQQMPGTANQQQAMAMAAMAAQYQQQMAGWQGQMQAAPGAFPGVYIPPASFPMPAAAPAAMPAPAAAVGDKRALEGAEEGQPATKQLQLGVPPATIPQRDGPADDAGEQPAQGAAQGAAAEPSATVTAGGDLDGASDELNEGDDLADVDDHAEIDEDSIKNVMVGQFDKVHRTKTKWKINLRGCVATINGKDYLLKKVTGEMNF